MLSDESILQAARTEGVDIEMLVAIDEEQPSERDPWDVDDENELDIDNEMRQAVRTDIFRVLHRKIGERITLDDLSAVRDEAYVTEQLGTLASERSKRETLETMCIDIAEAAVEAVLRREGILTNDDWKTAESTRRAMQLIHSYTAQLSEILQFSTLNEDLPSSMTPDAARDICTAALNMSVDIENILTALQADAGDETWIDDDPDDEPISPVDVSYDYELRCTLEKLIREHGSELTLYDLRSFLNNGFASDPTLGDEEAKTGVSRFLAYALAEQSLRSVEQLQPYLDRFERGSQEEELFLTSLTFRMMRELGFDAY